MDEQYYFLSHENINIVSELEGDKVDEVEVVNGAKEDCVLPETSVNGQGDVHNSLANQLESRLTVGQVIRSVEDAYLLYCKYAHVKGFSVRKGDQRYFPRTSELQSKEFECSCEGSKDEKRSSEGIPVYQKPTTRTKCKAKLKITREQRGEWKVAKFVIEHNHEMVAADQVHLLRSSRNISHAQKSTLEAMVNAGISVTNAVSYLENEVQGAQNLKFIRKDAYNHLNRLRKHTKVENGDASALLQYFIKKSNNEAYFYWNVQLDDDNRVMNFFFRDYRCRLDYDYFGDVLSIDTTYRTNRYNLICAPFVAINHHKNNVMFGLAFMSDETQNSFEWLFRTFLDSMGGKQPEIVFTDQCQAMMNAVETIFTCARLRLCQWHINQNAPSHIGSLLSDAHFKHLWHKCMSSCESEEEFEETWKVLVDGYNLSGHKWLNTMYKLRYKWATAFTNERFSAGLLATSRSEGTNSVLKKVGKCSISLYDFVQNYEKIQNNWRAKEKAEDTRCCHGKAPMILKNNPLLKCAADVYTLTIYKLFEMELINSLDTTFIEPPSNVGFSLLRFKVKSHGTNGKLRQVVFDKQSFEVKCSCHKFETMGILCKHVLKVFNYMDVDILPKKYIKRLWMKDAKKRVDDESKETENGGEHVSEMVYVNHTMRSTYDLVVQCKVHEETRNILTMCLDNASRQITDFFQSLSLNNLNDQSACGDVAEGEGFGDLVIRNPLNVKSRGITNATITRHWDDKRKKRKIKTNIGSSNAKCPRKMDQPKQYVAKPQHSQPQQPQQSEYTNIVAPVQYPFGYHFQLPSTSMNISTFSSVDPELTTQRSLFQFDHDRRREEN